MCVALPARVVALLGADADVELSNGTRMIAHASLQPDLSVGDYVIVDRGMVVATIDAEEAEAIIEIYAEIGAMLDREDALAETP